jgi:hypothetical protein
MTHKQHELSPSVKVGLGLFDLVQAVFAFLAVWDLWHRRPEEINGPKWAWVPALFVKWLGPGAYFLFGIKY